MAVLFAVLTLAEAAASSSFKMLRDIIYPPQLPSYSPFLSLVHFSFQNISNFKEYQYSIPNTDYLYYVRNFTFGSISELYDFSLDNYFPHFYKYFHYLSNIISDLTSKLYDSYLNCYSSLFP